MRARTWSALAAVALVAAAVQVTTSTIAQASCGAFAVSGISPAADFTVGGATETISGCGFLGTGTLTVAFGGASPITITPSSDTSFTVADPPGSAGAVTVTVLLHNPPSSDLSGTTSFTYDDAPTLTSIAPTQGPEAGGTAVHVTGTGFQPTGWSSTVVDFGASGAGVSDVTDTSLTATSPAGTGTQNVSVTTVLQGGAQQTAVTTLPFAYVPAPTVTSVAPTSGPVTGGNDVTVTGTGFQPGAEVLFGPSDGTTPLSADTPGTPVSVLSATSILVAAPPGIVGATNVVVINPDTQFGVLTSGAAGHYSYTGTAPSISMVSPASGSSLGGTSVTISGAGFLPSAHVDFAVSTTVAAGSDGVDVSTFAGAGTLDVAATTGFTPSGTLHVATSTGTAVVAYTGTTSTSFTGASLTSGSAGLLSTGGDVTQLTGGTSPAVAADGSSISLTTPAHPAGTVDVVVENPGGATVTDAGAYTFNAAAAPTVTQVIVGACTSACSGSSLGNTTVTIKGTGFVSGTTASFGGVAAASSAFLNGTTLTARTPAEPAGTVDVSVQLPDGQMATLSSSYTFTAAAGPTISTVTPMTGPAGTEIVITGTGFANTNGGATNAAAAAIVSVGAAPCVPGAISSLPTTCLQAPSTPPTPLVQSSTKIDGFVPDAPGGVATVTVTNPDGQSATGTFTYTGTSGPPSLTGISPDTGSSLGDTPVTLTGTGFVLGAVVTFGSGGQASPGTVTAVASDGTSASVTTPAGLYGTVDVTIVDPPGGPSQTSTLPASYTFTAASQPTITSVLPSSGPSGTEVTITGTGFATTNGGATNAAAPASVTVGGMTLLPLPPTGSPPSSPPVVVSSTSIVGIVPTEPAGVVDVAVVNPDGQGAIDQGAYTYPTDTTAPTVTATGTDAAGSYAFGSWAASSVTVALAATDNLGGSGVKNVSYGASGAQTISPITIPGAAASFVISAQGVTTVSFYSADVAGNLSTPATETVKIDTVAPTDVATATVPSGGGTAPYTPGTATNQNVTISFSCSDALSGVASLTYTSGATTTTSGTNPLGVTVTSAGANQSVTALCTDAAGNTTTTTVGSIDIVRTAPGITASASSGGQPYTAGTWTHQPVTVTFLCTPVSVGNQIASLTTPVQITAATTNGTVTGTCTDTAGNSSSVTFGTPSAGIDLDLTLPIASATATTTDNGGHVVPYAAGTWTDHDVLVTFHCTDAGPNQSGVASISPPVTVTAQGTTSAVTGTCQDVAGNTANPPAFFGPILIDKTAPSCSFSITPNPIGPANTKLVAVTALVTVTDALSGPNGFVLRSVTSNNPSTVSSDVVGFVVGTPSTKGQLRATKGRVYTFTYQGFDVAGNSSPTCAQQVTVK
jgi:hypothetical protein